ncbi:hypothetical protein TNCV_819441 [Trichonephila clavipes]|nr:hypothetical protein TNCV_819441 [Trichonephila clavipes]
MLLKSVGSKVLWVFAAETTGAGGWRIFPSPPVQCLKIVEVEISGSDSEWCCHSCRIPICLRICESDTGNEDNGYVIVEDIAKEDEILTNQELLAIDNKVQKFVKIFKKEFGTVIKDDNDTNIDNEKKLALEQKLELAVTKKIQQTKIQFRKQLYPNPSDKKYIYLKMRDLEVNTWERVHRSQRELSPVNMEWHRKRYGKLYEQKLNIKPYNLQLKQCITKGDVSMRASLRTIAGKTFWLC